MASTDGHIDQTGQQRYHSPAPRYHADFAQSQASFVKHEWDERDYERDDLTEQRVTQQHQQQRQQGYSYRPTPSRSPVPFVNILSGSDLGRSRDDSSSGRARPTGNKFDSDTLDPDVDADAAKARAGSGKRKGKKEPRVFHSAFGDFTLHDLIKPKFWKYYIGFLLLVALVVVASHYHDKIVRWFEPIATKIRDLPGGWLIFV